MKLFQIEEPDGSPVDPDAAGAAIGIDASGPLAEVAVAVGGNAVVLTDREGFERDLPVPVLAASAASWQVLFEGARLRAERALAQPATHAVVALGAADGETEARMRGAAEAAGLTVLRVLSRQDIAPGEAPALFAAVLAEDLAPRPGI